MQWNEVDLLVSPVATDLVALLVYECGSNGSVIDDEQPDSEGRVRITAYFPLAQEGLVETIREKMNALESRGADLGNWQVIEKNVNDEDWLFAWQDLSIPRRSHAIFGRNRLGKKRRRNREKMSLPSIPDSLLAAAFTIRPVSVSSTWKIRYNRATSSLTSERVREFWPLQLLNWEPLMQQPSILTVPLSPRPGSMQPLTASKIGCPLPTATFWRPSLRDKKPTSSWPIW